MISKKKKVKHAQHHVDYKVSSENLAMTELHIGEDNGEEQPEKKDDGFITYDNVAIPEVHIHKKKKQNSDMQDFNKKWQYILPVLVNVLPVCYYASALIFAYNCFLTK